MASNVQILIQNGDLHEALDELNSADQETQLAKASLEDPDTGKLLLHEAASFRVKDDGCKDHYELVLLLFALCPSALLIKDREGNLPIHYAVGNSCLDVTRFLLGKDPKTVEVKNSHGQLPLHTAMRWRENRRENVEFLVKLHPGGIGEKDNLGSTPLHFLLLCNASSVLSDVKCDIELLKLMVKKFPAGATIPTEKCGKLPIHIACETFCDESWQLLAQAYPEGLKCQDSKGNLPIHLACKGKDICCDDKQSPEAFVHLIEAYPDALRHQNKKGELPLHMAAMFGRQLDASTIRLFVDKYPGGLEQTNNQGELPIHVALSGRNHRGGRIATEILSTCPGCAKIPDNNGDLPIHIAVQKRFVNTAMRLMDAYPEGLLHKNNIGQLPISLCIGSDDLFFILAKRSPGSLFLGDTPLGDLVDYLLKHNLARKRADKLKELFRDCFDGSNQIADYKKLIKEMEELKATYNEDNEQLRSTYEELVKDMGELNASYSEEKERLRNTCEEEKEQLRNTCEDEKLQLRLTCDDEKEELRQMYEKEKESSSEEEREQLRSTFEEEKCQVVQEKEALRETYNKEKKHLEIAHKKAMEDLKQQHASEKRKLTTDIEETKRKVEESSAAETEELRGTIEELEKQLDLYKNDEKELRKLQKWFVASLDDQNNNLPLENLKIIAQSMKDRLDRTKAAKTPNAKKSGIQITFRLFIRSPDLNREDLIECIQTLETELTALEEETAIEEETEQVVPDVATSDDRNGNHSSTSNSWTGRHKRRRVSEG